MSIRQRAPRLYVILVAVPEVIGLTLLYAAKGFWMGVENTRDAWRDAR